MRSDPTYFTCLVKKESHLGFSHTLPEQSSTHSCCHDSCLQHSSVHSARKGGGCGWFSFQRWTGLESCRTHSTHAFYPAANETCHQSRPTLRHCVLCLHLAPILWSVIGLTAAP